MTTYDLTAASSAGSVPDDVRAIAGKVCEFLGVDLDELIVGDAEHFGIAEGAWGIAHEGSGVWDWPWKFSEGTFERRITTPRGWHLEDIKGCTLTCYPPGDDYADDDDEEVGMSDCAAGCKVTRGGNVAHRKVYGCRHPAAL